MIYRRHYTTKVFRSSTIPPYICEKELLEEKKDPEDQFKSRPRGELRKLKELADLAGEEQN